jgi:hypothetical protein
MTGRARLLWLLSALFLCRVLGQSLVAFLGVKWLPPMSEWYSGLMAYPLLLPSQIVILALMVVLNTGVQTGRGPLAIVSARVAHAISLFSYAYFAAMVLRYALTMALVPERRWFGGTIPILFHWVLALYLYVWSGHHLVRARGERAT